MNPSDTPMIRESRGFLEMLILSLLLSWGACASFGLLRAETSDSTAQVSYYSQIRPIF